jgi:hypothetical protein
MKLVLDRTPRIDVSRDQLRKYRETIAMWLSKYDTWEIGQELNLPEHLVLRWVVNFRELMRSAA